MYLPVRRRADGMYKLASINHTLNDINLETGCPKAMSGRIHEARAGGGAAALAGGARPCPAAISVRTCEGKRDEGIRHECVNQTIGLDVQGYIKVADGQLSSCDGTSFL